MKIEKVLTNEKEGLFVALVTSNGKKMLVANDGKLMKKALMTDLDSSCINDKFAALSFISAFRNLPVFEYPEIEEAYKIIDKDDADPTVVGLVLLVW